MLNHSLTHSVVKYENKLNIEKDEYTSYKHYNYNTDACYWTKVCWIHLTVLNDLPVHYIERFIIV